MTEVQTPSIDHQSIASETTTDGLVFLLNCYDVWSATPPQPADSCTDCFSASAYA